MPGTNEKLAPKIFLQIRKDKPWVALAFLLTEIDRPETLSPKPFGFRRASPNLQPAQFAPSANRALPPIMRAYSILRLIPDTRNSFLEGLASISLLFHFKIPGFRLIRSAKKDGSFVRDDISRRGDREREWA
jgi:hypothetical protein